MSSIFTKIINKEIQSFIVAENQQYIAFLDINPITKGHTLVIPKKEVAYVFSLDDITLGGLFVFAKKVAKAMQQVIPCLRIGLAVVGLEVPHAHVHLLPLQSAYDIDFSKPTLHFSQEELAETALQIKKALHLT